MARGVVRFASEVDHGSGPVERVIRADELLVEVYGEAPNRSKQTILAWRDTSFLLNRVNYHRDHLGIVANDFGGLIRLGDGEEVRDVAHPLSAAGITRYEFRSGDTLAIASGTHRVRVVRVDVRPVDPSDPAAVGTLYIDVDRAALVRFRFTFTPASYRDPTVEGIAVTLENALLENSRWLPWRQSIVIRRGTPWLDLPIRTVLRADWSIEGYSLGIATPAGRFSGPPIAGLLHPTSDSGWSGPLIDRLDQLPATDADVAAAEASAVRALGGRLVDGLPALRLSARGVSELIRVNRVQGVTPFLGARIAPGGGLTLQLLGGIGTSDHAVVGRVSVARSLGPAVATLRAERMVEDAGSAPVISGALNSLRSGLTGADLGDYFRVSRVALELGFSSGGERFAVSMATEKTSSVTTTFVPLSGTSLSNPALGFGRALLVRSSLTHRSPDGDGWGIFLEGGNSSARDWVRAELSGRGGLAVGPGALEWRALGGMATRELPAAHSFLLGGRGTLPGEAFRSLGGRRAAWADLGWLVPVTIPTPPLPGGHRIGLPSRVGPFLAAGVAGGQVAAPWQASGRLEPVAGLRLELWGPLLRFELGTSLRSGHFGATFDVHPDWWPLL